MIILYHVLEELEELDLHVDSKVCCEGAHPFVTFDPAKVDQIKLAYTTHIGWLAQINSQSANIPGRSAYWYTDLAVSSPVLAKTVTSTYCAYPWRDGQAEWALIAWM